MTRRKYPTTRYILILPALILTASLFLWFASDSAAAGNIYYVDSSITDTNPASGTPDCTSYNPATFSCSGGSASAYKTIADVNAGSFQPDDQVLFRKGQIWREQLIVPSSGTAGNPITFGAFGSGTAPVISAANLITAGSAWSQSTLYTTVASQTNKTVTTNLNIRNITSQTEQAAELLAPESFNVVRVRLWGRKIGTPTGNLFLKIYNDNSGAPGSSIGQSDNVDVSALTTDAGGQEIVFTFSTPVALTSGSTYYISVAGDFTISSANYVKVHGGNYSTDFPSRWRYTPWEEQASQQLYIIVEKDAVGGGVWETTLAADPGVVLVDGERYERVSDYNTISEKQWAYAGGKLYIYAAADPDGGTPVVEYAVRDRGINTNGKSHVTIRDLRIEAAKSYGIQISGTASNITVEDVSIFASHSYNIVSESSTYQDDVTVRRVASSYAGSYGILAGNKTRRWLVTNCTSDHDGASNRIFDRGDYEIWWGGGIKVVDGVGGEVLGHVIEYNTVTNAGRSINGTANDQMGIGIWLDLVRPASENDRSIVRYNKVSGGSMSGIMVEKTWYSRVYYNIAYNNLEHGLRMDADENGPVVKNNEIYNNVFYGNTNGMYVAGGYANTQKNVQDNVFKNNVATGNTNRQLLAKWGGENDGTYGSGNVYSYNALGAESTNFIEWGAGTYKSTYAAWETAYGGTTNSVQSDPLFTNAAGGDFTLQATSPAIDAGADVGLTADYRGTTVPQGTAPDIGAYEYSVTIGDAQFQIGQTISEEIAFVIPPADVALSPALGGVTGGTANGSTQFVVVTNNSAGFDMTLKTAANEGMLGTALGGIIPALVPVGEVPEFDFDDSTVAANTAAFAYTIEASTTADLDQKFLDDGSDCGVGSSDTLGSCWLNASTTDVRVIHRTTPTPSTGSAATLKFRAVLRQNATPAINEDTYTATTTITVTMN